MSRLSAALGVPIGMEDTIVLNDCGQIAGRGFEFLADALNVGMTSVSGSDTLDLALGFLEVSQGDPAMGGADMKGIGPI